MLMLEMAISRYPPNLLGSKHAMTESHVFVGPPWQAVDSYELLARKMIGHENYFTQPL
jgi:hypothetical protein